METAQRLFSALTAAALLVTFLSALQCEPQDAGLNPLDVLLTWQFSGTVIDAHSREGLSRVVISYTDEYGDLEKTITDREGRFAIRDLDPGMYTFTFSADTARKGATRYTVRRLPLASGAGNDSATMPIDISIPVELYPCRGSLEGTVMRREPLFGRVLPAPGVTLSARYVSAAMLQCSPGVFRTTTDSTGQFSFAGMPVADSLLIECIPAVFESVTYAIAPALAPGLIPDQHTPFGAIYLLAVDSAAEQLFFVSSNVIDIESRRPSTQFGLHDTIRLIANRPFDHVETRLLLDSIIVGAETIVHAETVLVIPHKPLRPDRAYTLFASITGAGGRNHAIDPVSGSVRFVTEADPIRILASNVLSPDGAGLTNIPTTSRPFFVLSHRPDSRNLHVSFTGGGSPPATAHVREDTIFAFPARNFDPQSLVTVRIVGLDTAGEKIDLLLNGPRQFMTLPANRYIVSSNVLTSSGAGMRDISPAVQPWFVLSFPFDSASLKVSFTGGGSPSATISAKNDTVFTAPLFRFANEASVATHISGLDANGTPFSIALSGAQSFMIAAADISVFHSNVLDKNGMGARNVPATITPYFVLSSMLDSVTAGVSFSGGGEPAAFCSFRGDTLFARPVQPFGFESQIATTISGQDTAGNQVVITLAGPRAFTTERALIPVESNVWTADNQLALRAPGDTLWVRFSEPLDQSPDSIDWYNPAVAGAIFGGKERVNARSWVSVDTLLVAPDNRIQLTDGMIAGFKVSVAASSGKRSAAHTFSFTVQTPAVSILWTNTRYDNGRMRDDFSFMDSVIMVLSDPVERITAIVAGAAGMLPQGISINHFAIRGDTVVYVPALALTPDRIFSFSLQALFANGVRTSQGLSVTWKTRRGVTIEQVDNIVDGRFRVFKAWGDSLRITFSRPIDTSAQAIVPFTIHARDNQLSQYNAYAAAWDSALRTATIKFQDTLPTADYRAAPAYTLSAANTRAIAQMSFDCVTLDGEQSWGLTPDWGNIEIHTESGICVTDGNFIQRRLSGVPVEYTEAAASDMPKEQPITLRFNRVIDTALVRARGPEQFVRLESLDGYVIRSDVQFDADGRGVRLHPQSLDNASGQCRVYLHNLPAAGIAGAQAINHHAGSVSGAASGYYVLGHAFSYQSPDISELRAELMQPYYLGSADSVRLGVSAGFIYSDVLGANAVARPTQIPLAIKSCAWNAHHADSVAGYEVQVQKVLRNGVESGWHTLRNPVSSGVYSPGYSRIQVRTVSLQSESFYSRLLTPDGDGSGYFFSNGQSLFNDSCQIQFRVRPIIGDGDPVSGRTGKWSNVISYADNVAPCDSTFVTGAFADSRYYGGVQITEHYLTFRNLTGATQRTGYIDIDFPEDMNVVGPPPVVTFYYGSFSYNHSTPVAAPIEINATGSGWVDARTYRCYIAIPPGDYTNSYSNSGAFYNVSVAGCIDASGVAIPAYGTDGEQAVADLLADNRVDRLSITDQVTGSASVIDGFGRCR